MTFKRKLLTVLVIITALGLLYPGVTQPVLTLTGTIEKSQIVRLGIDTLAGTDADSQARQMLNTMSILLGFDQMEGQVLAYYSKRSIWGTAHELATTGNMLVAFLIVFFSLVIPSFKLLLQIASLVIVRTEIRGGVLWLNRVLSKWSMADVFVMGLLVAYLAGSASGEMGELLTMDAQLESGFYFFLAYCLFSIAATVLMKDKD